jgi:hypothetical protein
MTEVCRERVPDNGDDYACENPLPCKRHPKEQTAAREAINEIASIPYKPFVVGETYVSRLEQILAIAKKGLGRGL